CVHSGVAATGPDYW
nr:immunoglobulin heavy chain junction region [Macaca mulatta]